MRTPKQIANSERTFDAPQHVQAAGQRTSHQLLALARQVASGVRYDN
jgi:hypothetical protein